MFPDSPIIPSDKAVQEFKELMIKQYNTDYSDEEAREGAYNLLNLFRILIKMDNNLFTARLNLINTLKQIKKPKINKKNPTKEYFNKLLSDKLKQYRNQVPQVQSLLEKDSEYPTKATVADKRQIDYQLIEINVLLDKIEPYIKSIKNHFDDILAQNKFTACYFIFGKIHESNRAIIHLSGEGFHYEIMELIRSNREAIDLVHTFLDDNNGPLLNKWFKGEIVTHDKSRESAEDFFKKDEQYNNYPIKKVMADIYGALSKYTHISYLPLLESFNVYEQDFDFKKNAGFYYINQTALPWLRSQLSAVIIALKHFYKTVGDKKSYLELSQIIEEYFPSMGITGQHISRMEEIIKKYKNK